MSRRTDGETQRAGTRLRVGLIDSGVNATHPHVQRVYASARVESRDGGPILIEGASTDELGHGTACAGLLRWLAPDAEIVAVRIFDDALRAPVERLPLALRFCLEQGATLINLSLGLRESEVPPDVAEAFDQAIQMGALVIAAHGRGHTPAWPASHAETIAVAPDPHLEHGALAWIDEGVGLGDGIPMKPLLLAAPFPRPMPGQPRERNMSGVSFAAAAVTGILAGHGVTDRAALRAMRQRTTDRFRTRAEWLAARGAA